MDPHGSLAIPPKGRIIKAENEQARKPPAPYTAFHGHPRFAVPAAGMPGWHWGHPVHRGWWKTQARGSGALVLVFGGRSDPLGAGKVNWGAQTQSRSTSGVEAAGWEQQKSQALLPGGPRTPSDQAPPCFLLPQPPYPTDSDPGALGGHSAQSGVTSSPDFPSQQLCQCRNSCLTLSSITHQASGHRHREDKQRLSKLSREMPELFQPVAKSSFKDRGCPAFLGLNALRFSCWERLPGQDQMGGLVMAHYGNHQPCQVCLTPLVSKTSQTGKTSSKRVTNAISMTFPAAMPAGRMPITTF